MKKLVEKVSERAGYECALLSVVLDVSDEALKIHTIGGI